MSPPAVVSERGALRLHRDADAPASGGHQSARAFHLVPDGQAPVARVTTERNLGPRVGGHPAVYRVEDPTGTLIGRITLRRGRFFRLSRTRWTVEPANGPALRGYRGRLVWWALWWPVGLPVGLLWLITSLLGEGDGAFGPPRRVIWRDGFGRAHVVFRGLADEYRVLVPGWDPRLVTALVGLHQSFDPSEGGGALGWYEA
ncbi:hypothetical protein [Streptomyces sp. AC627_RSS907]|uniref:hypothetical protein n=1 Tax=Streptomyces sp. AC627_RSS907 TaxID=2823684 RepID=UPI001C242256|nr:hypothetical protein [Streptomyces sp. AC627_RSS907]